MDDSLLLIVGGQSVALEIREAADLSLSNKYSRILNLKGDSEICPFTSICDSELVSYIQNFKVVDFIVGFVDVRLKQNFEEKLINLNCNLVNVLHPTAYISKSACIGKGNYFGPNVVISSLVNIGNSNLINFNTTIGHNSIIGSYCALNPGCRISGNVNIDSNCIIGSNTFIYQGLNIAHDCQIDAMSYISKDLDNPIICKTAFVMKTVPNIFAIK